MDYFKELLSITIILNDFGILKPNSDVEQYVDLISVDEMFEQGMFDNGRFSYEREKLISSINLDKETNILYKKALEIPTNEFLDEDSHEMSKLSKIENEKLRLEYYYDAVLELLFEYTQALEKINTEYDLKTIDEKITSGKSILYDSKINLYSPLLFRHEQWEKVILNELMLSNSLEEVIQKKRKFMENLVELEVLLPYSLKNIPLIDVNETNYWLQYWNEHKSFFIYPLDFWLGRKKHFLESLGDKKLKRLFDKARIKRYNEAKKTVKKIKNQLRRSKIEVKQEKYLTAITQGMTWLLSKENPNFSKSELHKTAEKLISNLFYSSNTEPEEHIIDTSIKINNIVLVEFIVFLKDKKQYLTDKKISIPKLIRDNLNYDSIGFSYKNLITIYNTVITKKEFNFNGLTSINALSNEMKMRNY